MLSDRVRIYDQEGGLLALVYPGYVAKALDRGEIGCGPDGRYRLRQSGGYRSPAQIAHDKAVAVWERARSKSSVTVEDAVDDRGAAARKAWATRRAQAEAARGLVSA